jgi:hypothetical protein
MAGDIDTFMAILAHRVLDMCTASRYAYAKGSIIDYAVCENEEAENLRITDMLW